jgi:hypothetical protein
MQTPKCECGCEQEVSEGRNGWNRFVHGHHAKGRKKSDDEKRRIGEKNSANMKRYMSENPNIGAARNCQMLAAHTPEITTKRIAASNQTYASMTDEDKQGFVERTKSRWESGDLAIAHKKSAATFRQRSAAGEYDFAERNQKLSESIARKYIEGGFEWSRGKYVSTKTGKTCYYRSSWELILMKELDDDQDVSTWESESMSIPYQFDGATHRYIPDFLVVRNGIIQIIEVKPVSLRVTPKNIAKREATQVFCAEHGWNYLEWAPITNNS